MTKHRSAPDLRLSIAQLQQTIVDELGQIGTAFAPDELAYLALTTKLENQIRNRLAWRLHQHLEPLGLIVARDWFRSDLAILDDAARPLMIVQSKAVHAGDVRSDLNWAPFATRIQAEVRKSRKMMGAGGEILLLAVGTSVHGEVDRALRSVLKYTPSHDGRSGEPDEGASAKALAARLRPLGPVQDFRIADGQAFKLQVRVDGFLVGPL